MSYYLAPALEVLRSEINQRWPGRDRASDGWIGDRAHQATKSDHNPNSRGSVNALDVDADGVHFPTVLAAIVRHPSARYVIFERRLYHRLRGWRSEPYSGVNPHVGHFHISIDQTRTAEQDRRPWGLLEDDMDIRQDALLYNASSITASIARMDSAAPVKSLATGKDATPVKLEIVEAVQGLQTAVAELAKRPAVDVDYDKLADALLRRVIAPSAADPAE